MKSFYYLISLILLISQTFAYSDEKVIHVGTLSDYPPYCFSRDNGKPDKNLIPPGSDSTFLQGYSWDILRESFHAMAYSISLHVHPWQRVKVMLEKGKIDLLFPTAKNLQREKRYSFSKETVDQVNFLVYIRNDCSIQWTGLSCLNELKIGEIRGWSYGDKWNNNQRIQKRIVNKIMQGFYMLDNNRLDGFAGYEIVFDYTLKQTNMKSKFKKLPSFDNSKEYLAGLISNSRVQHLLKDFDTGKRIIIHNGVFDKIENKWR
jgi:polar amino acid transport system substrate-binding protein